MPGGFSKTSKKICIRDGHYLEAWCKSGRAYPLSFIDLDRIFGYKDGRIVPGGKNLSRDLTKPLKLGKDGLTVEYLDRYIGNEDGILVCEYGQDHCSVCRGFPGTGGVFRIQYKDLERSLPDCPMCHIINELSTKMQNEGVAFQATSSIEGVAAATPKAPTKSANLALRAIFAMLSDMNPSLNRFSGFTEIVFEDRTYVLYLAKDEPPMDVFQLTRLPRVAHLPESSDISCVSTALDWITGCVQNHAKCSSSHTQPLPARVVDVGHLPSDGLRLKVTNGEQATYACLSHCWGRSQTLMLKHDNIETIQSGIEEASLQTVYREAIAFCRQLGIRYIWIDTLCIIQDDNADWTKEAAKMGTYYSNCHVCLAATSAKDHDGRCSISTSRFEYKGTNGMGHPWRVFVRPGCRHIDDPVYNKDLPFEVKAKEQLPLLKRAWVYQERRLSPRVLHFCETEMSFECNEKNLCLCGKQTKSLTNAEWTKSRHTHFGGHGVLSGIRDEKLKTWHEWNAHIVAYSRLNLTFDEDRLPALSGLARLSQQRRQSLNLPTGDYLAGLWRDCIIDGLAWCVGKSLARFRRESRTVHPYTFRESTFASKPRPERYVAPTWSWASVLDPVQYPPFQYEQPDCKILDARVELATSDAYGRISSGLIVIEAHLLETSWSGSAEHKFVLTDVKGTRAIFGFEPKVGDPGMLWWPDYDIKAESTHSIAENTKLWLMPLASRVVIGTNSGAEFRVPTPKIVRETIYLVLRNHFNNVGAVYERIGWSVFTGQSTGPDLSTAREAKIMLV